ncbi:MAG: hypothetical protein ACPGTO_06230 [Polaribacter sp.]
MDCFWLKKIDSNINDLFKNNWSSSLIKKAKENLTEHGFDGSDEYYNDLFSDFFTITLKEFSDTILLNNFEFLNYSIISGECFHNPFLEEIESLINNSGNLQYVEFEDGLDNNLIPSLENIVKEKNPLSILKECLIEYKSNAKHLLRYVENPSLHTLFDLSDRTNDILENIEKNDDTDIQKQLLKLTKTNFILLKKDFALNYDIEEFQKLLISKNDLINIQKFFENTPNSYISKVIPILIEKSVFIIRKFIIRKSKEEENVNENYVFLGEETDFELTSHKLKMNIFKDWDKYSINHFLSEENSSKIASLKRNAKTILEIGKVTAKDFHSLAKYYKDLNRDYESLKKLLIDIDKTIPRDLNTRFDKYSIDIIKNYISNNIFSERLRTTYLKSNPSIGEVAELIEKDLKKIEKLQDESAINNFFPYYKICGFLEKYITKKISNNNSTNQLDEVKKGIEYLKKYFNIFKLKLKWSKSHLNYAYQLPFSECIKTIPWENDSELNIFCSSTFSLPIDFKKYNNFENSIYSFILRIENEIKGLSSINSLIDKYDNEKENLQNELKQNTKKNIELLGLFSAIIALTFGGISIAENGVGFKEKFISFITLFVILFSFIVLLKSYVNNEKGNTYEVIQVFIALMILLIVFIFIFSFVIKNIGLT